MADVVIINKIESCDLADLQLLRKNIATLNPTAAVVDAVSPSSVDKPELIRGKKVLVIEEGPTVTHGEIKYNYGSITAQKYGATELVDPRPYAVGKIKKTFEIYPGLGTILPSMGYSDEQIKDLETTIKNTPCDAVVIATPIDLNRIIKIDKPSVKIGYELFDIGTPSIKMYLDEFATKFIK